MTFIKVKRRGKSNNLYRGIDLEEHTEKGHMEEHLEEGASEHLEEEHLVVPHPTIKGGIDRRARTERQERSRAGRAIFFH